MPKGLKKGTGSIKKARKNAEPRCLGIAQAGIKTGSQFAAFMSAIITDVIEGNISPQTTNAAVNAGGKLLKIVDMQMKYGRRQGGGQPEDLNLTQIASDAAPGM